MDAAQDILEKVKKGIPDVDFSIEDGEVWYSISFRCEDYEEPGDVSWSLHCDLRYDLELLGLTDDEWESDNDTIWGKVIYK